MNNNKIKDYDDAYDGFNRIVSKLISEKIERDLNGRNDFEIIEISSAKEMHDASSYIFKTKLNEESGSFNFYESEDESFKIYSKESIAHFLKASDELIAHIKICSKSLDIDQSSLCADLTKSWQKHYSNSQYFNGENPFYTSVSFTGSVEALVNIGSLDIQIEYPDDAIKSANLFGYSRKALVDGLVIAAREYFDSYDGNSGSVSYISGFLNAEEYFYRHLESQNLIEKDGDNSEIEIFEDFEFEWDEVKEIITQAINDQLDSRLQRISIQFIYPDESFAKIKTADWIDSMFRNDRHQGDVKASERIDVSDSHFISEVFDQSNDPQNQGIVEVQKNVRIYLKSDNGFEKEHECQLIRPHNVYNKEFSTSNPEERNNGNLFAVASPSALLAVLQNNPDRNLLPWLSPWTREVASQQPNVIADPVIKMGLDELMKRDSPERVSQDWLEILNTTLSMPFGVEHLSTGHDNVLTILKHPPQVMPSPEKMKIMLDLCAHNMHASTVFQKLCEVAKLDVNEEAAKRALPIFLQALLQSSFNRAEDVVRHCRDVQKLVLDASQTSCRDVIVSSLRDFHARPSNKNSFVLYTHKLMNKQEIGIISSLYEDAGAQDALFQGFMRAMDEHCSSGHKDPDPLAHARGPIEHMTADAREALAKMMEEKNDDHLKPGIKASIISMARAMNARNAADEVLGELLNNKLTPRP